MHDAASAHAGTHDAWIVSMQRNHAPVDDDDYTTADENGASRAFWRHAEPAHDGGACSDGWRGVDGSKRHGAHGGALPYGWAGRDRRDTTGYSCDWNMKARNSGSNSWNPRRYRRHHRHRPRRHPRQPTESCHPIVPASQGDRPIPVS